MTVERFNQVRDWIIKGDHREGVAAPTDFDLRTVFAYAERWIRLADDLRETTRGRSDG